MAAEYGLGIFRSQISEANFFMILCCFVNTDSISSAFYDFQVQLEGSCAHECVVTQTTYIR